jgi:hypothetical protein
MYPVSYDFTPSINEKNPPSRALSATQRLKWPCALLAVLSGPCFPLSLIYRFLYNFNQYNSGVALS